MNPRMLRDYDNYFEVAKQIVSDLDASSDEVEALGVALSAATKLLSEVERLQKLANEPSSVYRGRDFDGLHNSGAQTWGWRWLSMNMALRDAMSDLGIDFSRSDNAMICTTLATAALGTVSKWKVDTDDEGKIVFHIPREEEDA